MELNKKTLRKIFLGVVLCIVLYWLLHETERVAGVVNDVLTLLMPFIAGAAVAFVLNVPMRAIERGLRIIKKPGARRGLSITTTILAVLLVVVGVVYLIIPQVVETIETLVAQVPGFVNRVAEAGREFLNNNPELMQWLNENTAFSSIDWSGFVSKAVELLTGSLGTVADRALAAIVELSTGIFNGVISLVFALYCLARKEILARQGRRLLYAFLPEKVGDETVRILRMTNSTFSNFISGQCLEAVILGCMFAVSMAIFGMPYIPLISVLIAVTALVPIVGAFVGCVLGAFFILVNDPMQAVWFVVLFLVLQQIEGNLIYPRVMGTSIGLPGMWVLLAVAVGGDLMGIGGMLAMIPLASVLYALAREITQKRLTARGIDGEKLQNQPPELKSNFKEKRKKNKEKRLLKQLLEKQGKKEETK